MVATQISREPAVRKCIRQTYFERAKLNLKPTKKGTKVSAFFFSKYPPISIYKSEGTCARCTPEKVTERENKF